MSELPSGRMLKKSASSVLASLRGSTYRSVRLASLLAAALLAAFFSILKLFRRQRRTENSGHVVASNRVFRSPLGFNSALPNVGSVQGDGPQLSVALAREW